MEDERPPPPPPPHGHNPRPPGGGLPDGNYDIFIIPPHSAGGGFVYLPSLQPHRNSFIAGMFVAMAAMGIYVVVMPVLKAWLASTLAGNGAGVMMLVAIVGVGAWAFGKTTAESSAGPGGNTGGADRQKYRSNGPESQNYTPPPPPPHPESGAPPPQSEPEPPPKPKPNPTQSGWERAREETKRKEEERKRTEELKRRREAAQKIREEKEAAAKKAREEAEAAEKKAREEKEAAEKEAREAAEKSAKAKAEKERWEQARAKEKLQRDRETRERELKAAREKEALEKEAKEREAKAAADAAQAAAVKEAATKASRERIAKLLAERAERGKSTRTASASGSPNTSPTKNYVPPTSRSAVGTEDAYSYRPYDKPTSRARSAFQSSASSVSGLSESSYAPSMSTARTTPPPSQRGPYSTNEPGKIQIRGVYLFSDSFPNKPTALLVAGEGSVTDGLILKIETEGLFIDDDVRKVGQREWDVKAWTISTMETGASKAKGLHIFRATTRDSENKKYTFVIDAKEAHKVTQGVHRLKDGSLARSVKVKDIKEADMNKLLTSLGW